MRKLFLLFPFYLALAGCSLFHDGRSITGQIEGGTLIPDSASRIFIRPFNDAGADPEFNEELMRRLKNRINLDGRLAVVTTEGESDLVLDPGLSHYEEQNVTFNPSGRVVKRRISLTVSVGLSETATGKIILKNREKELYIEFDPDRAIIAEVYRELADKTSAAVLSIIFTGWAFDRDAGAGKDI